MADFSKYFRAYMNMQDILKNDFTYNYIMEGLKDGDKGEDRLDGKTNEKVIDMEWVVAIEETLPYIQKAIDEQRRFIKQVDNVVRVELAKKIGPESVKHLSQHTNFIAKVEGDMVTPNKILTIEREESFAIYENRVLMTLIRKALHFVDDKYSKMKDVPNDSYNDISMVRHIDFNEKKGFICDMDGVIYHGNQILPGVTEFIQWLHDEKKEYLFLTNNSGYTPRELNQKLARMGLDVPEEHFYTSALATAAFLKEQAAGCSAFVIGEAGLLNALYDVGITMNDVNPDYVVVGEGRSYSLDTLTKATNLVLKGAKLIGANSDVSGPIENGIAPACRALIAPIEMATGTQAYFCGKPNPLMMRTGLNMLGCHSAEAVMVGDRMDTDVISGMESGMSTVLVLSGCSTKDTLKTYAYLPTMVLNGVGDIASIAKAKEK